MLGIFESKREAPSNETLQLPKSELASDGTIRGAESPECAVRFIGLLRAECSRSSLSKFSRCAFRGNKERCHLLDGCKECAHHNS